MEGSIMKCPECQFDNADGMNFCGKCGYKLSPSSKTAPKDLSFDEKLEEVQKYLPKGLAEKVLSQRDKIEGERKHVTVMFCDIVGFSQLSELLGPEEAYSFMDQVYEILIHIVHDHGGTINEFTGDGVMALFGVPITLEDASQRAIRSAYTIHMEITNFSDKLKQKKEIMPSLKMRIGIHTGPVVVGALGNDLRVEFKAVGETVNLASRMEGLAEPGTTYVTEDIFKLTQGLFQFEAVGAKEVKGKNEPVPVYKLQSAKEEVYRPRLGLERMIYSEMVGREKELDRLQLQVMKVINREGSIVNLIGEAGIGKSRLVVELKSCDVIKKVALFEGRAVSMGRNFNFHPIINLLKEWAQITEGDSEAVELSKLETAVRQVYPEGVHEVLPFVATLMGMNLSGRYEERVKGIEGDALEKLILKNVKDLLIKATELNPLVIVAEDLHWADTSSIELMESLFSLAETQRILFVNVFRPGHRETGDRIVESIKEKHSAYYVEILLQPLNERMSEILITNMLSIKGLQPTILDQIIERAGGNPFFIEEVVRSFIDEGAVVTKDGAFQVTEKIDNMVIPDTINDVLMARIDRLEEETRNLVKVASVIGRSFFHRILAEVAMTVEDIDNRLSYLKEIQLIRERRRMEELEYLFKHALAQEAAYESILLQKRKELHLKVADCIEKVFEERLHEFYGMLAFHYSSGEDLEKAEEYMIKAGEIALKSSASSEALHYYQEALKIFQKKYGDAADPGKVAMLEKNIAIALYNKGKYLEAIKYFDKALVYLGEKIPKHLFFAITKFLFCFFSFIISLYIPRLKWKDIPTQKDIEIIDLFTKKITALSQTDPNRMFIESIYLVKKTSNFDLKAQKGGVGVFAGLGAIFSYSGISLRLSKKILGFCRDKITYDDLRSTIFYEMSLIAHNYYKGDWNIVEDLNYKLVNEGLSIGEIFQITFYIEFHAMINLDQGYFNNAQKMVKKLFEIANAYENQLAKASTYELNTKLLVKYRKYREALNEIEEGITFGNKIGLKHHVSFLYTHKAQIQVLFAESEKADESLRRAKEFLSETEATPTNLTPLRISELTFYLYRLEEFLKSSNQKEVAKIRQSFLKSGKKAIKLTRKRAAYCTEAFRLMGTYYWIIGKEKKALRLWDKSISEGERIGARLELSRTYFEIGKRLSEPKSKFKSLKGTKSEEFLEKARTMFEDMDLQWDIDELAKLN
jgi:class 3 adenylate cyclase/tetratricopeptide (TPR) repeat protein